MTGESALAATPSARDIRRIRQRMARLAVVQGLYQMEMSGSSAEAVRMAFRDGHLPEVDDITPDADRDLFEAILAGVIEQQSAVDTAIARRLQRGWKLERIDSVARAILRAGTCEVWRFPEVSLAAIIGDYVEIAKGFFDGGDEPAFINAALDRVAHDLRPAG